MERQFGRRFHKTIQCEKAMIVISPWAKKLTNGQPNPKNYPWWPELLTKLKNLGHELIQVGIEGEPQLLDDFRKNLSLSELEELVKFSDTWFSVGV